MEKRKIPAVRFKGFEDDWEQRKVGDYYEFKNGLNKGKEFFGEGTPIVNFTDVFHNRGISPEMLSGKVRLELSEIKNYEVKKGDIFFTRTSETIEEIGYPSVMLREPENTVFSGFVLRGRCFLKDDPLDNLFKKYIFFTDAFRTEMLRKSSMTTRALTSGTAIKNMEFLHPSSKEEQHKIGELLTNLDYLITLHQRKLEKLQLVKKSMLEKMFPKNGSKIPEIRFEGFTDDWEQRKLGKLYQRNTERNENLIGYDKTISVATMSYKDDGNGASESSLSTYKVLRVGDIAFEGHTNKQFRFGRFVVNDIGTGIMSPRFSTLRPLNEMPVNFWKQYIHSESVMRRILVNSTKAGTMMNELVIPEFLNQTIMVPSENEQAVIGQYFTNLDNLITLHQRKLEKMKSIKKSLLEKLFVQ